METLTFEPDIEILTSFPGLATIEQLSQEIGVYSASPDFVRTNCGPLVLSLLDLIPESFYEEADRLALYPNCDIRIHRLYPGDFPAYPGWHCDGEYRENYHAQPELSKIPLHHAIVGSFSSEVAGVSNTLFLNEVFTATPTSPSKENTLWGQVHEAIAQLQNPTTLTMKDGQLLRFSSMTLHKVQPTTTRGWRLFFRMGMWHKDYLDAGGKVSRQEQVYKLSEATGW
jgi:hypothetical protein